MSLKSELKEFAQKRGRGEFTNGGEFERLAMDLGFKPSNASRRLRELENEGFLEVRYNEKRCAEYRYKPPELPPSRIPLPQPIKENSLFNPNA